MGFFDKITEQTFKINEEGETIYYPNGLLGKGRLVGSVEKKEKLYNYQKRVNKYFLPFSIFYGILIGLGGSLSLEAFYPLLIIYLFIFIRQRLLIRGLPIYGKKHTVKETTESISKIYSPNFLKFMGVMGVFSILISFFIPFIIEKPINEIVPLFAIPFGVGAFSLVFAVYFIKLKKSNKALSSDK